MITYSIMQIMLAYLITKTEVYMKVLGNAVKDAFMKELAKQPMLNSKLIADNTRIFVGLSKNDSNKGYILLQSKIGITFEIMFCITEAFSDYMYTYYHLEVASGEVEIPIPKMWLRRSYVDNTMFLSRMSDEDIQYIKQSDTENSKYTTISSKQKEGKSNLGNVIMEIMARPNVRGIVITKM